MPTSEPELAALRIQRLKRTLKRMAWVSLLCAVLAVAFVARGMDGLEIHILIATAIMAGGSVLVASFLMTLIFFSNQSGHDADAHEFSKELDPGERPE
ncbi:hypothetical protein [Sphingomicrobium sediminis]|uniref:Uncharacterized protein n=1 Tax=Sphingomicrobium sediminis TaxID=2950949 RepID=A0A9X2EMP0_9SPHN|nr:hypothetical protein [Sphingomicrobium sediminis]MCM8558209.1 hypothetical protein [Sphingomicrobium sediminis]